MPAELQLELTEAIAEVESAKIDVGSVRDENEYLLGTLKEEIKAADNEVLDLNREVPLYLLFARHHQIDLEK
jgi:hypothetical protein